MKLICTLSKYLLMCFIFLFCGLTIPAQEELTYQMPPEEIVRLVDAPPTPRVSVSPDGKTIMMLESPNLPAIEEVAQPELRLAGTRSGLSRTC